MPDKPFVINDRRKWTMEGDLRPDAPKDEPREEAQQTPEPPAAPEPQAEAPKRPQLVTEMPAPDDHLDPHAEAAAEDQLPPAPTPEQSQQASRAYEATVDRLDTAVRAMDPGANHTPPMSFDRMVQSLYMQAILQLGGASEPGQPMQVDLMGARATIDMLGIIADKTRGNLSETEDKLVQSALFELRLGFLDMTQALAKQAQQRSGGPGAGGPGGLPPMPGSGGPSIVR